MQTHIQLTENFINNSSTKYQFGFLNNFAYNVDLMKFPMFEIVPVRNASDSNGEKVKKEFCRMQQMA